MGRKALRSNTLGQQTLFWKKGLRWTMLGLSSLSFVCIGLLPAMAAELSAWRYDSRSRSLTLTLPGSVTPNISVTAPNQLLVELPDTQIGDVRGRQVNDGFVEQIALEQATPETLWMVVDFVPGTVLSDTQQATPLAASSNTLQLWKVQPTLLASRRVVDAAIAGAGASPSDAGASALAVEVPSVGGAIAQADFPDLPVLEPAVPLSQPVSVPPIDASAPVQVPERSTAVSVPELESPIQADAAPVQVPVVVDRDAIEALPPVAAAPATPAEPPFIGGIDIEVVETVPLQPSASVAVEPRANIEAAVTEQSEFSVPTGRVNATNNSRWPEPIPFGQPLP